MSGLIEDELIKEIHSNKGSIDKILNYALFLFKTKRYEESEEYYLKALAINQNHPKSHEFYSSLLIKLGRFEEAEKHIKRLIEINSTNGTYYYIYGEFLYTYLKKIDEAEEQYKKAIQIESTNWIFLVTYAKFLIDQKRCEEANEVFKRIISQNKEKPYSFLLYANFLFKLKKYIEAEDNFKEAISKNQNEPYFYYDYANLLSELKRYKEAEEKYKKSITIDPNIAEFHNNYAKLLYELKRYEEAEAEFQKAIALGSNDGIFNANYAIFLVECNRNNEAENQIILALNLFPNSPEYLNIYGNILSNQGFFKNSLEYYQKALKNIKNNKKLSSLIKNNIGWVYSNKIIKKYNNNDYKSAKKAFEEAIAEDQLNVKAINNLRVLIENIHHFYQTDNKTNLIGCIVLEFILFIIFIFVIDKIISDTIFLGSFIVIIGLFIFCLNFDNIHKFSVSLDKIEIEKSTISVQNMEQINIESNEEIEQKRQYGFLDNKILFL